MPAKTMTIEELYCAARKCGRERFLRSAFWTCLHRRALPFAPFILLFNSAYFSPDRELISAVGGATSMSQVGDEIGDYFSVSNNGHWVRRNLKIRVSSHRVLRFASKVLPPRNSTGQA
jgi:hypothetical protein